MGLGRRPLVLPLAFGTMLTGASAAPANSQLDCSATVGAGPRAEAAPLFQEG